MSANSTGDIDVLVTVLDAELAVPEYAHPGDAGADLRARVDVEILPGQRVAVPTGIALALPGGFVGFVVPRSGLARRQGIGLGHSPGTIAAGYRGEIEVLLINHDPTTTAHIERGDRIAQLVIQPIVRARFHVVERLPGSHRGEGGFGSSGR